MGQSTFLYDRAIRGLQLIDDVVDDGRNFAGFVPCRSSNGSAVNRERLIAWAKEGGYLLGQRHAKRMLEQGFCKFPSMYNALFLGTRWQDARGGFWFPCIQSLCYVPGEPELILTLVCVPDELWVRHGHHHLMRLS